MTLRLIALSLVVATLGACKKDSSTETPEPVAAETPVTAPEPEAEEAAASEPEPAEAAPEPAAQNLITIINGLEQGKTFAELLVLAELDRDLASPDVNVTVLVPSDDAFAKLPKGTLDKWKKSKDQLQKVLKYHFVPGRNDAAKMGNYRTAPTAAGPELTVKASQDSDMTIDGGRLTDIDIAASNGLIHIIDKVLQPKK
jgi:uncharacterized surface protein with fasciclin (FAS1) repeats